MLATDEEGRGERRAGLSRDFSHLVPGHFKFKCLQGEVAGEGKLKEEEDDDEQDAVRGTRLRLPRTAGVGLVVAADVILAAFCQSHHEGDGEEREVRHKIWALPCERTVLAKWEMTDGLNGALVCTGPELHYCILKQINILR